MVAEEEAAEQRLGPLLVIVPRDQRGRYASLAAEFEGVPGCRVILDPRRGSVQPDERVSRLLGLLAAGQSQDEILRAYPYLEPADITEALR